MSLSTSNPVEYKPILGMIIAGYVASTQTDEGVVRYGPFGSREAAHAWAENLVGISEVYPIYEASWNRG